MMDLERDEMDAFQSIAALVAYVNMKLGIEAVQRLLVEAGLRRETLQREAAVLKQLGLTDLAKVVSRAARKARPTPADELPFLQRMRHRQH